MPTTSRSSPTTTSAVKEKRRPPLTTLATRLISTTRSWRSPAGVTAVLSRAIGSNEGIEASEGEAALASALRQRLHPAVVLVAAAVEDAGLDARLLCAGGEHRAGLLGLLGALERGELLLGPGDRRNRVALVVVDELRLDAPQGAEHGQPRTLRGAAHLGADATPATQTLGGLGGHAHARLPTFLATYSPS